MLAAARIFVAGLCLGLLPFAAAAYDVSAPKQTKLGLYMTVAEAAEALKAERAKVLFVDVRSRAEVQFVGYTEAVDGVVPFVDMSQFGEWDDKAGRFKLDGNPVFSQTVEKLLAKKGLTKADKVILMCRSGDRSAKGVDLLAAAGFTNVYNQIEGFEGDLSKDGRRTVNGWKNANLAWTYKLDKAKVFEPGN
ncbi:MAG: rhodanese-like domain-containing protein [Hyphomicrobiaceae bacterium]